MTLDREKLQQTLAELHAQLDEADSLDADLEAQLRRAASGIELALEKRQPSDTAEDSDAAEDAEPASTPELLEDAAVQFEQSHPTIAGTVRRLIDVLAQMGI